MIRIHVLELSTGEGYIAHAIQEEISSWMKKVGVDDRDVVSVSSTFQKVEGGLGVRVLVAYRAGSGE